ncbi:MAG: hypothetical protein EBR26_02785 [Microbacteriaceae bacterium]|nr:hypothetical protein [Microbacteriaceae bacterium]
MTNQPRLTVSIVGAGPVGLALAKAFADAGHSVVAIATTDPASNRDNCSYLPHPILVMKFLNRHLVSVLFH